MQWLGGRRDEATEMHCNTTLSPPRIAQAVTKPGWHILPSLVGCYEDTDGLFFPTWPFCVGEILLGALRLLQHFSKLFVENA